MASVAVEKKVILSETESGIFEKLRGLRLAIARKEHVPPFVVFSDATLEDMVSRLPRTEEEMAEVHGIGAFKLKKYGERFLAALGEFSGAEEMREKTREKKNIYERLERLRRSLAKRKSVDITNSFRYSPPSDRRNPSGHRRRIPRCERHHRKSGQIRRGLLQALHPERSRISPKQKVKCRKKRTCHSQNGKTVRGRKGKITMMRKETVRAGQTAAIDIETRAFFLYLKKSKSAACQRRRYAGGKHLCRQGFGKDGEKRNRVPKPACRCKSGI